MNIYLSPHHDDACFSIGYLMSQLGGELVNLFTTSCCVTPQSPWFSQLEARTAEISELRRQEDLRFATAAGLRQHNLGFADTSVSKWSHFDLADVQAEADAVAATLIPYILSLLPADSDPTSANLYCPMGIGAHRNHVSTLLAVRSGLSPLNRRCTVFLYEDLDYACRAPEREAGLAWAADAYPQAQLWPFVMPLDAEAIARKMQWISFYQSQHCSPPRVEHYTPASGEEEGPHEIIWRLRMQARPAASAGLKALCTAQ